MATIQGFPGSHIIRSESSVYPAGIITVVIVSIEKQGPRAGSLQAAIPRWSLGHKIFVDISPKTGLSIFI